MPYLSYVHDDNIVVLYFYCLQFVCLLRVIYCSFEAGQWSLHRSSRDPACSIHCSIQCCRCCSEQEECAATFSGIKPDPWYLKIDHHHPWAEWSCQIITMKYAALDLNVSRFLSGSVRFRFDTSNSWLMARLLLCLHYNVINNIFLGN